MGGNPVTLSPRQAPERREQQVVSALLLPWFLIPHPWSVIPARRAAILNCAQRCTSSLPLRGAKRGFEEHCSEPPSAQPDAAGWAGREQRVGVVASRVRRLKRAQARSSPARIPAWLRAFAGSDARRCVLRIPRSPRLTPRKSETSGAFPCRIMGSHTYDALAVELPVSCSGTAPAPSIRSRNEHICGQSWPRCNRNRD